MCGILDSGDGEEVVRAGRTAGVELSEGSEGQPMTTQLALGRLDGPGDMNLSIHKGTIIHHPKQL